MQRVLVIGCSGAGKSTLARELSGNTGLPLIHLDQHYWRPGWRPPAHDEWAGTLASLREHPCWIMDGNYTKTLALRLQAADTVIFLDFPTWLCLWRVVARTLRWLGRTRLDMTDGCPERFDRAFIHYVMRYNRDQRPRVVAALTGFAGRLVVLRRPSDVAAFLRSVPARG